MFLNGEYIGGKEVDILNNNRGFLYGDGFFETMLWKDDRILFASEHADRIRQSLQLLGMSDEHVPSLAATVKMISTHYHGMPLPNLARLRMSFYRDAEGTYTPEGNRTSWILQLKELPGETINPKTGIRAGIVENIYKAPGKYGGIKSISSQLYVMAAIEARNNGWDDGLVLNCSGNIIESTHSNIFVIRDNIIKTPGLGEGCIDGICRRVLIRTIKAEGIPFMEEPVTRDDIAAADELILTNAIRGVQWIEELGERRYGRVMAERLQQLWEGIGKLVNW